MQKFWQKGIVLLLFVAPIGAGLHASESEDEIFMFRPPTLVNLTGHPDYSLLMLKFNLFTDSPESTKRLEYHQPLLHHHLIMMLSSEDPKLITSSDGKAYVESRVITRINEVLTEETGKAGVTGLTFLEFILE